MVVRTDPALWERVKKELTEKAGGKWSARVAQQAVQEYKKRGGGYKGAKPKDNSLVKWTSESWGYAGKEGKSRYLPKKVREALTPALRAKENRLKGSKLGQNVAYSAELVKLMKEKGIL